MASRRREAEGAVPPSSAAPAVPEESRGDGGRWKGPGQPSGLREGRLYGSRL